MMEASQPSKTQ